MNNTISYNSIGVRIDSGCFYNTIYLNRFVNNAEQARDFGKFNRWDDGISLGNYWSDYEGIGPYQINGDARSRDHHPEGRTDTPNALPLILTLFVGIISVVIIVRRSVIKKH
jgi:hypothetical protein